MAKKLTPMMQQYLEIKEQYKDCILFFRLGDFYEMFFDDALTASREMEVTLTGKSCGLEERAPMCGVPYHAADTYIHKLIEKGYKVAICEQTEDPAQAKGIVRREVIKIVTPGTLVDQTMLKESENNYIASVFYGEEGFGLVYCDISTGELAASEYTGANGLSDIVNELVKINVREAVFNEKLRDSELYHSVNTLTNAYISILSDTYFDRRTAENAICRQFAVKSVTGLGFSENSEMTIALGGLLSYLLETQKQSLEQLTKITITDNQDHMILDKAAIRNLELTETLFEKKIQGSLLGVLDYTGTAMGSRKLKKWIKEPLNNSAEINKRLDAVELLTDDVILRNNLHDALKSVYDLERLSGRIACGNANGRDMLALRNSVALLPEIRQDLTGTGNALLVELGQNINPLSEVYDKINNAIKEDPPLTIKEGGIIKDGYSSELDDIKQASSGSLEWIMGLEAREKERTGIKTLKVGFNRVFGYYIEVSKKNSENVPEDYVRKQTLVNCERYITPELKEMESLVLNAESRINALEYELFTEVREFLKGYTCEIQDTASAIADLDVLVSFAEVSSRSGYVKPVVNDGDVINIVGGRHPVIEQTADSGVFVSNDTYVNMTDQSLLLITGPNMAGKSTYMRQTALIVLMAQMGCFVPAESAEIGTVDRVYTRIGASDNLTQGQSTFFVEMSELAYILNTATDRSLVILDEIGRGTSTYDGLSIAWAVVEYLCRENHHIRTLFASHYHELTALENIVPGLKNFNVSVSENAGDVVFLHKIVQGSASRSYGIHVAKIAGVPRPLLERAAEKLKQLESDNGDVHTVNEKHEDETQQLSFLTFTQHPAVEMLKELDIMSLTPSGAIAVIEQLKKAVEDM
jgi:DNA mismatch repair protein MutS